MIGRLIAISATSFNTQPPEGGWRENMKRENIMAVSTHSRLKAAAVKLVLRVIR